MSEPRPQRTSWFRRLGPGLITGAADDDPGGIATHSQVGAQFGFSLMWTVALTYPLMTAIQAICARIGRVTGEGLAANMAHVLPRWLVHIIVFLLFVANTVNIGADLAAMGAATRLVLGWGEIAFAVVFAVGSMLLQVFVPYHRYVHVLKWLTLSLLAYVGVVFTVAIDWGAVVRGAFWPSLAFSRDAMVAIVAVFGTTISPYMFFWQSAEEVEDEMLAGDGSLLDHPEQATTELNRIAWDTYFGMGFSSLISFFIVLTTAVTLHSAGITDIATSARCRRGAAPDCGRLRLPAFQPRHHRHGALGLACPRRIGRLCDRRVARLAHRPGTEAGERQSFLWRHRACVRPRPSDSVLADRPDQGAVLERRSKRRDRGAANDRHNDRRFEPEASWSLQSAAQPQDHGLARYGGYGGGGAGDVCVVKGYFGRDPPEASCRAARGFPHWRAARCGSRRIGLLAFKAIPAA